MWKEGLTDCPIHASVEEFKGSADPGAATTGRFVVATPEPVGPESLQAPGPDSGVVVCEYLGEGLDAEHANFGVFHFQFLFEETKNARGSWKRQFSDIDGVFVHFSSQAR